MAFTRMDQLTAEMDAIQIIGDALAKRQAAMPEVIRGMLRQLASHLDGFPVDQLEHSVQTATRAERAGASEENDSRFPLPRHRQSHLRRQPRGDQRGDPAAVRFHGNVRNHPHASGFSREIHLQIHGKGSGRAQAIRRPTVVSTGMPVLGRLGSNRFRSALRQLSAGAFRALDRSGFCITEKGCLVVERLRSIWPHLADFGDPGGLDVSVGNFARRYVCNKEALSPVYPLWQRQGRETRHE